MLGKEGMFQERGFGKESKGTSPKRSLLAKTAKLVFLPLSSKKKKRLPSKSNFQVKWEESLWELFFQTTIHQNTLFSLVFTSLTLSKCLKSFPNSKRDSLPTLSYPSLCKSLRVNTAKVSSVFLALFAFTTITSANNSALLLKKNFLYGKFKQELFFFLPFYC